MYMIDWLVDWLIDWLTIHLQEIYIGHWMVNKGKYMIYDQWMNEWIIIIIIMIMMMISL